MKLAEDSLLAIMGAFRKGLLENIDISALLRALDLVPDTTGKLRLNPIQEDIWSLKED